MSRLNRLVAVAAAGVLGSCGVVPVSKAPVTFTLGTAPPGGGFPVYGDAFVAAIREADPAITIEARNTKGSAENIPLLDQGKLDLALVQGAAAYEAIAAATPPAP